MGIRQTQEYGLPVEAIDWLLENELTRTKYDSAADYGMFDDGPDLMEYECKNGKKYKEVVQACPWSSGPCIFLKLVDETGKDFFVWTEEDIENSI